MRARAAILLAAVAVAVAVALAGAGCGSDGDAKALEDYVGSLNRAQGTLAGRFTELGSQITATSTPAQDQRTLSAYEAAVREAVTRLRAVEAPAGFGPLHRRFIDEVGGYGVALRTARTQLRSDDPQEILAAQGRLRAAVDRTGGRLDATIRAINDKLKG